MKYMKKTIDPFTELLPKIDVHGYDRDYTIIKLNEFINESIKLHNYHICVVHGIGSGTLKSVIHEYLKKDKRVISFNVSIPNIGQTEIYLKKQIN